MDYSNNMAFMNNPLTAVAGALFAGWISNRYYQQSMITSGAEIVAPADYFDSDTLLTLQASMFRFRSPADANLPPALIGWVGADSDGIADAASVPYMWRSGRFQYGSAVFSGNMEKLNAAGAWAKCHLVMTQLVHPKHRVWGRPVRVYPAGTNVTTRAFNFIQAQVTLADNTTYPNVSLDVAEQDPLQTLATNPTMADPRTGRLYSGIKEKPSGEEGGDRPADSDSPN